MTAATGLTEKMQTILGTLERGVEGILTSETYQTYLAAMARFHRYSFNNTLLIALARPDATRVAGFHTWRGLGRWVRKGERGIAILVPHRVKVAETDTTDDALYMVLGFGIGHVFDIAQTEGEPLPEAEIVKNLHGDHDATPRIIARLTGIAADAGVPIVATSDGPRGYWDPTRRRIGMREDLAGVNYTKTLAHEVAHMLADHRGGSSREDAEDVAESAAYVTLAHFSIDTGDYSFGYVAGWAKEMQVVRRNLAEVQRIAHQMIEVIGS